MSDPIKVLIGGGIGDIIVSIGILKALKNQAGPLAVTCNYPEVYHFYTGETSDYYKEPTLLQDYDLHISNFAMVLNSTRETPWNAFHNANIEFIEKYNLSHYLQMHPFKDGIASDLLCDHGFTRETLAAAMLGFYDVPFVQKKPDPIGFWETDYITVHDGYGLNHSGTTARATKTWDLDHWSELVKKIKLAYPQYKVVQLGAETGRKIQGVDYSFLGSFSVTQSFQLLAQSRLHIDGDSGLVHAAKSFGVRSVVLFGPTPARYFGYPENINIQAPVCKPCWWSNDTWVSQCPRNYKAPICMNSILPETVFKAVEKALA